MDILGPQVLVSEVVGEATIPNNFVEYHRLPFLGSSHRMSKISVLLGSLMRKTETFHAYVHILWFSFLHLLPLMQKIVGIQLLTSDVDVFLWVHILINS